MEIKKALEAVKGEMKPSMGCTEPVAIGLAVSRACAMLSQPAQHLDMVISSNIFKNAYSVQIPNAGTNGISLACVLGCLLAKPDNTMEIFANIKPEHIAEGIKLVDNRFVNVKVEQSSQFYISCVATNEKECAKTITVDAHDHLVYAEKDGKVLLDKRTTENTETEESVDFDITKYTFADFLYAAENVESSELNFIKEGVEMNLEIAKRGLEKRYALGIGPAMQKMMQNGALSQDMVTDVKLTTAAACDFRMSGGDGSVMTYLGSGNQGIETMIPIAVAAKHLQVTEETMLRAEFLGMLCIMYMKKYVGRLSPICGATLAGAGSAAGMAYMMGGGLEQISGAVQNMMGGVAGMFCDGAKGGCALKLSICAGEAVYAALYAMDGSIIGDTDGIISNAVEETTKNLTKLSQEGLADVDMKVIEIMQHKK